MYFRDDVGCMGIFEAIAIIDHQGQMTRDGEGQGHYRCDVKQNGTQDWYQTNDNNEPVPILIDNVTKKAVVVLYSKIEIQ